MVLLTTHTDSLSGISARESEISHCQIKASHPTVQYNRRQTHLENIKKTATHGKLSSPSRSCRLADENPDGTQTIRVVLPLPVSHPIFPYANHSSDQEASSRSRVEPQLHFVPVPCGYEEDHQGKDVHAQCVERWRKSLQSAGQWDLDGG